MTFIAASNMSLRAVREARRAADASSSTNMDATASDDRLSRAVDSRDLHSRGRQQSKQAHADQAPHASTSLWTSERVCDRAQRSTSPSPPPPPPLAVAKKTGRQAGQCACGAIRTTHLKRVVKAVTRWCMMLIDTVSDRRRQARQ